MSTVAERIAALNAKKKADAAVPLPTVVRTGAKWQKPTSVETTTPSTGAKTISPRGAVSPRTLQGPQPTKPAPSWIKPVGAGASVTAPRVSGTLTSPVTSPQSSPTSTPSIDQRVEASKVASPPVTKNVLPVLPISVKQPVEPKTAKVDQPAETKVIKPEQPEDTRPTKVELPKVAYPPVTKDEARGVEAKVCEELRSQAVVDEPTKPSIEEAPRPTIVMDEASNETNMKSAVQIVDEVVVKVSFQDPEPEKTSLLVDDAPVIVPVEEEPTREPEPSSFVLPPPIPPSRGSLNTTEVIETASPPARVEETYELPKTEEQKSEIETVSTPFEESKVEASEQIVDAAEEKELSPSTPSSDDGSSEHAPMLKEISSTSRRSVKFGQNDEIKVEEFDYHDLAPADEESQTPPNLEDGTRARRRSSLSQKVVSILKRASRGPTKAGEDNRKMNGISWG